MWLTSRVAGMSQRLPRMSRVGMTLLCDMCGEMRGPGEIRPFSLVANFKKADGRRTTRSFGSIDLCRLCWASKATDNRRNNDESNPFE